MISILIPTLGRHERLQDVVINIQDNTQVQHEIVFITEADDQASQNVIGNMLLAGYRGVVMVNNYCKPNYSGAVLSGYNSSIGGMIFMGADDIVFSPNWDVHAMHTMIQHKQISVVGTNDLHNEHVLAGYHATHYLVDRRYLDHIGGVIDAGPRSVLHMGYDHNYSDTEFIATARYRGVFASCLESIVEHRHFVFGLAPKDATYEKAYAQLNQDALIYESRRHLWGE